jgi:predicted nucleic acid-binding protein
MDKLLIDCNILIDWLTDRQPFSVYANELLTQIESKNIKGYVSPLTLSNTYYILRKQTSKKIANEFLNDSKKLFNILDITKEITITAINKKFKDFEDDLHYFTAIRFDLDFIITRNKSDFPKGKLKILTAEEYIRKV